MESSLLHQVGAIQRQWAGAIAEFAGKGFKGSQLFESRRYAARYLAEAIDFVQQRVQLL
jgi:hypothetical protein